MPTSESLRRTIPKELQQLPHENGPINESLPLQHTIGHFNCPACEKKRSELISSLSPDLEFSVAAHLYMDARSINAKPGAISARYIRENTEESYLQYIRSLELFFAGMKLGDIHLGHFGTYQEARVSGASPFIRYRRPQDAKDKMVGGVLIPAKGKTSCPVKAKKVNQELGFLQHVMKRANCWTEQMEELYEPLLDDDEEIPRALTPEEQRRWLDISRMETRWNVVHWYSILCFDTCMSTDEVRALRIGDVNLYQRIIVVNRGKVRARVRTIELVGADVLWALECLLARAKDLGGTEPHHYLFPGRANVVRYDATKPMSESGIKKSWLEVRAASKLTWFRQYDCRHTAISRLAEQGVPTDIIMSRAGHVSEKMRRHYTHISQSAQRKWMERAQGHSYTFPEPQSMSYERHPPRSYPSYAGSRRQG